MMQESATLNVGQWVRVMKSTTDPWCPRKARSARLPSAPPRMSPRPTDSPVVWVRQATTASRATTTTAVSRDHRRRPAEEAERGTRVEGEGQAERPEQMDRAVEVGERQGLGHLVERDDRGGDRERDHQPAAAARGRPSGRFAAQRRDSPPLLHATHRRGVGQGAEPGLHDRLVAPLAGAVGLLGDPHEGVLDLLDRSERLGREGEVALAVDRDRPALARLLIELHVAGLALLGQRVGLRLQRLGLLLVDPTLGDEGPTLLLQELGVGRIRPDRGLGPGGALLGRGLGRRRLLGRGCDLLGGGLGRRRLLGRGCGLLGGGCDLLGGGLGRRRLLGGGLGRRRLLGGGLGRRRLLGGGLGRRRLLGRGCGFLAGGAVFLADALVAVPAAAVEALLGGVICSSSAAEGRRLRYPVPDDQVTRGR